MPTLHEALKNYFGDLQGFAALSVSPENEVCRVPLPEGGLHVGNLKEFARMCLGDSGWTETLPDSLPLTEGLFLTRLETDSVTGDVGQASFCAAFQWLEISWSLLPGISITDPGLMVGLRRIDKDTSVEIEVGGTFQLGGMRLILVASVPDLSLRGFLPPKSAVSAAPLLQALHLDELGFDEVQLADLAFNASFDPRLMMLRVALEDVWQIEFNDRSFKVDNIDLAISHLSGADGETSAAIGGQVVLALGATDQDNVTVDVQAQHEGPNSGWQFSGIVTTGKSLKDVVNGLGRTFGASRSNWGGSIPSVISSLTFKEFDFSFNTRSKDIACRFQGELDLAGKSSLELGLQLTRQADKTYQQHFDGKLLLGQGAAQREFDVLFDHGSTGNTLIGVYQNPAGDKVKLRDLVNSVTNDTDILGLVPDGLSFTLKSALVAYRSSPSQFFMAVDMDMGIDLSGLGKLPLIGQALGSAQSLSLKFQPVIGTTDVDWSSVSDLVPPGAPAVPAKLEKSFQLKVSLKAGEEIHDLSLKLDDSQSKDSTLGSPVAQPQPATSPDPAALQPSSNLQWIPLQRHFGPLTIQRVGVGYDGKNIDVALDADFAIGPVSLALEGLGAQYNLTSHDLTFMLQGAALEVEKGTLNISAAFLRDGSNFAGLGTLRMGNLTVSAMGAFGEVQGHPSLFLYATANYPLGGPAFFFIEGFAAGFGVNRRLIMPPIDEVAAFPLVAAAISGGGMPKLGNGGMAEAVAEQLRALDKYVPPELGQYFFAAGIKFTSFKLIQCFALLAVSFGNRLEIDVLGMAKLTHPPLPPNAPPETPVMACAELAFLVQVLPDEGLLRAEAQLTANSFVYDRRCHLTGGFAFYNWFSGPHAGDFVTTLGGYHPQFVPPSHYPQRIPRLGFNWQVTSQVLIKGAAYFALTPNAVMAGGLLEATYDSGDLHAWFHCAADFLMYWKPFHYQASASVEIGASLTVHCFGTHRVTISAGADLEIWGPQFSGHASVHVKVLIVKVNFDVSFGDSSRNPPAKISWTDFQSSFLQKDSKICSVSVAGGLIRTLQEEDGPATWIVNPKEFVLATDSLVPSNTGFTLEKTSFATTWNVTTGVAENALPTDLKRFGIEPMGAMPTNLTSFHSIRVVKITGTTERKNAAGLFAPHPTVKSVPRALWSEAAGPKSQPGLHDPQTIQALTGCELHPATPPDPGASSFIKDSKLAYSMPDAIGIADPKVCTASYAVKTVDLQNSPGSGNKPGRDELLKAFVDSTGNRAKVLDALGFVPARDVSLGDAFADEFVISPGVMSATLY